MIVRYMVALAILLLASQVSGYVYTAVFWVLLIDMLECRYLKNLKKESCVCARID